MKLLPMVLFASLASLAPATHAFEAYGGVGTTGVEVGFAQPLAGPLAARIDFNGLKASHHFTTSDIDYDARLKASNAGAYLDLFLSGGFRLTGGALIGDRKIHGVARSMGGTITLNGVTYPVSASDTLTFDADFPNVSPYVGIGYGHRGDAPGWHVYADAGVAFGRPDVRLSPSASLAAKVSPADIAGEQAKAQDQANDLRAYPVVKLGLIYTF